MGKMTNCDRCNASVYDVPLYRVSEPGEDGKFWCEKCCNEEGADMVSKIDPETKKLMDDIKDVDGEIVL